MFSYTRGDPDLYQGRNNTIDDVQLCQRPCLSGILALCTMKGAYIWTAARANCCQASAICSTGPPPDEYIATLQLSLAQHVKHLRCLEESVEQREKQIALWLAQTQGAFLTTVRGIGIVLAAGLTAAGIQMSRSPSTTWSHTLALSPGSNNPVALKVRAIPGKSRPLWAGFTTGNAIDELIVTDEEIDPEKMRL